ncbi:MAG TPA: hypothetical protein GXZ23_06055 [Clostridiales bacterium]|jgi:hypothetical protein|nr:hypothetical protein [Clostridiales bacterium]
MNFDFDFSFGREDGAETVSIIEIFVAYLVKLIEIIKKLFGIATTAV